METYNVFFALFHWRGHCLIVLWFTVCCRWQLKALYLDQQLEYDYISQACRELI